VSPEAGVTRADWDAALAAFAARGAAAGIDDAALDAS
jgi:hypothetical protein